MVTSRDKRIYLDYAATAPLDPAVRLAMLPYFGVTFGNPSSLHSFGQAALSAVDRSRESVARLLGVGFREVIFTGSATEANNLALRGVVARRREEYPLRHHPAAAGLALVPPWRDSETFRSKHVAPPHRSIFIEPKIIVSAVEHESVLETARAMERAGEAEVVILPVDRGGIVDLGALERALDRRTVLVSIQYVNNETGTVQPISTIAEVISNWKKVHRNSLPITHYPLLHIDAVQAWNYLDCALPALGADLLTLSAHKCYGPKGVGVLAGNLSALASCITGGGQEFGLRSGTENVAGIVGCAAALALSTERREKDAVTVGKLAETFFGELQKRVPGTELNGAASELRAPHILNIALPKGCTLELVVALDQAGVAVSTGSACASRATAPSHVLRAMGITDERIRRSLRVSFGRATTRGEVMEAVRRMGEVVRGWAVTLLVLVSFLVY